jgi:tetratricopeptide (TPR) repeat protein
MPRPPNIPKHKYSVTGGVKPKPAKVPSMVQEGLGLIHVGRFNEAIIIFDELLKKQPNDFNVLQVLGALYSQTKQPAKAVDALSRALEINPNFVEAYYNRSIALNELGLLQEALVGYDKAISINSNYADAHFNRGNVLNELGRLEEALESYDKAISIKADYAEAYSNRGIALQRCERLEEALADYDKAISIKADYAEAYSNRGTVFKELGRLEEALESYDKAISIKADYAEAYSNRGITLKELGRLEEALLSHHKAVDIKPDYAEASWNLSLCNLLMGNFQDGWQGYEWGWKNNQRGTKRNFLQPLWLGGESLKDKTILIWAEQGVGDVIQFCRYLSIVRSVGCRVIFEVPKKLIPLMRGLTSFDELIEQGKPLPLFNYHCPLMSLPLAFKTDISTIPQSNKYLDVQLNRLNEIKQEIALKNPMKKPLIGISWHSIAKATGISRSIELKQLIESLSLEQVQYVNLQYGDTAREIEEIRSAFGVEIAQSSVNNHDDIVGLSALIDACEVIVSIDNTTVHLAGALGKPTLVLLPFASEWRWLLDRDDSPWYQSIKLYRQERMGDWSEVLSRVKTDLQTKLAQEVKLF